MSKVSKLAAGLAVVPVVAFAVPAFADSPGSFAGGSDIGIEPILRIAPIIADFPYQARRSNRAAGARRLPSGVYRRPLRNHGGDK